MRLLFTSGDQSIGDWEGVLYVVYLLQIANALGHFIFQKWSVCLCKAVTKTVETFF